MADFVHCNTCYRIPTGNLPPFFLTNCGHLVCKDCLEKSRVPNQNTAKCGVCQKICHVIEINATMDKKMLMLFMPVKKILENYDAKFKKVHKFQMNQITILANQMASIKAKMAAIIKYGQQQTVEFKKLKKEAESLRISVQFHQDQLAKSKDQIESLKQNVHTLVSNNSSQFRLQPKSPFVNDTAMEDCLVSETMDQSNPFMSMDDDLTGSNMLMGQNTLTDLNASTASTTMSFSSLVAGASLVTPQQLKQQLAPTPSMSQQSNFSFSEMVTPKIMGSQRRTPNSRENPYIEMWNRTAQNSRQGMKYRTPIGSTIKGTRTTPGTVTKGSIIPKMNTPAHLGFRNILRKGDDRFPPNSGS